MSEDWRQRLAKARTPATPAQDAWDARWQFVHDLSRQQGMTPNQAIRRADRLMDQWGHGDRPEAKETQ